MTRQQGKSPRETLLKHLEAISCACSEDGSVTQITPKPENELELRFLGIQARARGALAVIAITVLVSIWLVLQLVHEF